MKTALSAAERESLRAMTARIAEANTWPARILREAAPGDATEDELIACLAPRGPVEVKTARQTLRRLIAAGKLRERALIEPEGRAVRVQPVMVLEVVA